MASTTRSGSDDGGPRVQLEDDALFLLDTQPDHGNTVVPVLKRRRRATKEKRLTRAQMILAEGTKAKPLGTGGAYAAKRKSKTSGLLPAAPR